MIGKAISDLMIKPTLSHQCLIVQELWAMKMFHSKQKMIVWMINDKVIIQSHFGVMFSMWLS